MSTVARALVVGWLAAALLVLALDGRLPVFLACAGLGSLLVLAADALVRWHRRPSLYCRPRRPLPDRYRVADDLRRPLVDVWPWPSGKPRPGGRAAEDVTAR
jgi:hypothetical protein